MKRYLRILLFYILFMLILLGLLFALVSSISLNAAAVANYSDEELRVYKKIWSGISTSADAMKQQLFLILFIFWAVLFVAGLLFLAYILWKELLPILEMSRYAQEVAKGNLDVPLPMRNNTLCGSFVESFDLMREALKLSRQREIAAEQAKRELVGELSHDLKTPVATIKASCEVLDALYRKKLSDEKDAGRTKEYENTLEKIGYINSKAETINQLTQNVFRVTLEDLEEIEMNVKECDSRLIEGYFTNLKDYGNVILKGHVPECLIYMDPLRMEQVIDNIVGNSYKYAGTDVSVSFEETGALPAKDGGQSSFLRITVRDFGPGIPEEELSLVTEKFFRGKNASDKTGYGLGLYLVKYYMEKQGGGMEYYNDQGFVVELMVRKV